MSGNWAQEDISTKGGLFFMSQYFQMPDDEMKLDSVFPSDSALYQ